MIFIFIINLKFFNLNKIIVFLIFNMYIIYKSIKKVYFWRDLIKTLSYIQNLFVFSANFIFQFHYLNLEFRSYILISPKIIQFISFDTYVIILLYSLVIFSF